MVGYLSLARAPFLSLFLFLFLFLSKSIHSGRSRCANCLIQRATDRPGTGPTRFFTHPPV